MDFANLNLQELAKTSGEWLRGSGPESDIVISSRIRLARNLADFPFISRATDTDRAEIGKILRGRIEKLHEQGKFNGQLIYVDVSALEAVDRQFLQQQADDAVAGLQGDLLEAGEDPGLDPLVAPLADRGGPAGAVGYRGIRAAEPQDLDQLFEDDPVRDPGLVAAQRVRRVIDRPVGQQRGELVPQRFQQP